MRHILAIVDRDIRYAERLADYINLGNRLPFKAMAYGGTERYAKKDRGIDTEILLISEEEYREYEERRAEKNIMLLSEEGFIREREGGEPYPPMILKYNSAEEIIRDILRLYQPQKEHALLKLAGKKSALIGVFSPVNRCGKTQNAIALSMVIQQSKKTLLLCFDEYLGIFSGREYEADLSDLLYCFKQGNYSWDKLSKAAYSECGLNFIPPARYAEDLAEFSIAELSEIILKIASESDYEAVVIDFGALGKRGVEIFELCDRIYMPQPFDERSRKKEEEFYQYLKLSGREGAKEKLESYRAPLMNGEEPKDLQDISCSRLTEYWRQRFAGGER
ncbi:MAG: hypothetical protein Q4A19_01735 [Johnsonella sp.]|nr:hypothetical protein [Johnsonella sp.]